MNIKTVIACCALAFAVCACGGNKGGEKKDREAQEQAVVSIDDLIIKAQAAMDAQDYDTAYGLYRKAAGLGVVSGIEGVAECLESGKGVSKADPVEASKWYHDAVARYLKIKDSLEGVSPELRAMEEAAYKKALEGLTRY